MLKDMGLSVEEFFAIYSKEEVIDYIEDLYYIGDCFSLYDYMQSSKHY